MARTYQNIIYSLLKKNGIRVREVYTYKMNSNELFSVGSNDDYFRTTIEISNSISLADINKISMLLGTDEIEITCYDDGFYEKIIEVNANHVDKDNVKIQLIYAESRNGK